MGLFPCPNAGSHKNMAADSGIRAGDGKKEKEMLNQDNYKTVLKRG
jgi:hypothetical protein